MSKETFVQETVAQADISPSRLWGDSYARCRGGMSGNTMSNGLLMLIDQPPPGTATHTITILHLI